MAGYWEISPFIIDDTGDGNYTWAEVELEPWCEGNGTQNDPYIIKNIKINGSATHNCIEIRNSKKYFKISNCTVYNSGTDNYDGGIKFVNVTNGMIFNNTCSNNGNAGILLMTGSNNNTIINNTFYENIDAGIYLYDDCSNNSIVYNKIKKCYYGIYLSGDSNDNTISLNNITSGISYYGIRISSDDNILINNRINDCGYYGIYLAFGTNGELSGNKMKNCGIMLQGGQTSVNSYTISTNNTVNGKPVYYYVDEIGLDKHNFTNAGQILLVNCSNSYISDLNLSKGSCGLGLFYSSDNTFKNNTLNDNTRFGFYVYYYCTNNSFTNNTMNNNYFGIEMYGYCNNNSINKNIIRSNSYGIRLYNCDFNNVTENNMISNSNNGIFLQWECDNNIISNNTLSYNGKGILIYYDSDNNTISNNAMKDNSQCGIELWQGCKDNDIIKNIISNEATSNQNNGIILNDDCDNNTFTQNSIYDNINIGAYIKDNNCADNLFDLNYFIGNYINAQDDSNPDNNQWDNGSIGNYWDDYKGNDLDKNGIGDTDYNITGAAGSQDHFPIYLPNLPGSFILDSTADDPNTDGAFDLIWTDSLGADNYSIYTDNEYINNIHLGLTLLADQNAISPFPISGLSEGDYYYVVVAHNESGYTLSNCISITVQFLVPPGAFILNSTADDPDTDGAFDLIWTDSSGADNYSIFLSNNPITTLSGSETMINESINDLEYSISSLGTGIYYYVVAAYNEDGYTLSNNIQVTIEIPSPRGPRIPGYNILYTLAFISIISIILINIKRKPTKH